ncbi:Metallo-dependent phosphatase-like protein [Lasiosphaeris hirsuta]|uniref:Metallo-dependent phosphatase-like protein n=1 Tax=Lasiosphaeris hirsuta TaxID=260670 RepID=A0AA40DIQ1_9PEZI|nr:Metallo-dependent phosphatase-like protein [Lasiosphaeris hirsuta]
MLHSIFSFVRPYTRSSFCRLNPRILGRRKLSSQHERRKIRIMILSDTHGSELKDLSLPRADVVLHCGDLTKNSRSEDFQRTLAMLCAIDAPLKLAIPDNHDFSLEPDYWIVPAQTSEDEDEDGADAKASWELLRRAARRDSIFLLPQGMHIFVLPLDAGGGGGGARLRLFTSPPTPRLGNWGFQYDRSNPRKWAIPLITPKGDGTVDVVMTHGPPRGIRDGTGMMGQGGMVAGAGCAGLLAAVECARPRVHCFGYIHGAWGAELVAWKREMDASGAGGPSAPIFGNLVHAQRSRVVASLPLASETTGGGEEEAGCFAVDISPDGEHAVERGSQTLFVNAAVEPRSRPRRMPWLVDMDLPVAGEEDAAAAAETMSRLLL